MPDKIPESMRVPISNQIEKGTQEMFSRCNNCKRLVMVTYFDFVTYFRSRNNFVCSNCKREGFVK